MASNILTIVVFSCSEKLAVDFELSMTAIGSHKSEKTWSTLAQNAA
jgi:hypothetical protein